MYHVLVHSVAESVLRQIRRDELLHAGDRVGVAVSGGIDSVALLRLFDSSSRSRHRALGRSLQPPIARRSSDTDQQFVAALAHAHGLEFHTASGDVAQLANEQHSGVEAAARELRYGFFRRLLGGCISRTRLQHRSHLPPAPSEIATGHTLDDQAETVLMRVIRRTYRGLWSISPHHCGARRRGARRQ